MKSKKQKSIYIILETPRYTKEEYIERKKILAEKIRIAQQEIFKIDQILKDIE